MPVLSDHLKRRRTGTLDLSESDLYVALDRPPTDFPRRRLFSRAWVAALAIAVVSFVAGLSLNAAVLHLGGTPHTAKVVIGEQVIRPKLPPRTSSHTPPPATSSSLAWGAPVSVDPGNGLRAVSCASNGFCAAVDDRGQVVQYAGQRWSAPRRVDGTSQLNSISCTGSDFCVAVDQQGDAVTYNGTWWSAPQRIDRTTFPELTSVSCSSSSFCAAVDGEGNGLTYNGSRWSPPQLIDPLGFNRESRDEPAVSCPDDGFCVGITPVDGAFFYVGGAWQSATSITSAQPAAAIKYFNPISCSSNTFCVGSQNLGELLTYDGTQWSQPVAADPTNNIAALSCVSASFCAAVDSLLPPGFNGESGNGNGQVVTYNGINWSNPQQVDSAGIVTSIACPTQSFCMVADDSGHVVIGTSGRGTTGSRS